MSDRMMAVAGFFFASLAMLVANAIVWTIWHPMSFLAPDGENRWVNGLHKGFLYAAALFMGLAFWCLVRR